MKATYLASSLIALSLLLPASSGVVRIEAAQHGGAQHMSHSASTLPGAVRRATARFLDVDDAIAAGYVQFQGCVSGQNLGAMGVHYVNPALFDDRLEVDQPEALVYEPKRGRRLQLVAVEYITPAAAWQGSHDVGVQPALERTSLSLRARSEPLRAGGVLRAARLGVEGQPARHVRGLESAVSCEDWEGQP